MEIQDRVVRRLPGGVGLAAGLIAALAIVLVAVMVTAAVVHKTGSIPTSRSTAASTLPHEQAPDAVERNDIYYAAMCSGFNDVSPDARDRNTQRRGC